MNASSLDLPERTDKPRERGLSVLIDTGLPTRYFQDVVESSSTYIDLVKFGWGTSVVSENLEKKIACLQEHDVSFFFGGTLFEKFYQQRKVSAYYDFCQRYGCQYMEISNGTIDLSNADKAKVISDFA